MPVLHDNTTNPKKNDAKNTMILHINIKTIENILTTAYVLKP
jgi:hypothetical protein